MKLTRKEIKAVRDSIKHWETDIVAKFDAGLTVMDISNSWSNGDEIHDFSDHCAMCQGFSSDANGCLLCPYVKAYGAACDDNDQAWDGWAEDMTKKNALAMIEKLKGILTAAGVGV